MPGMQRLPIHLTDLWSEIPLVLFCLEQVRAVEKISPWGQVLGSPTVCLRCVFQCLAYIRAVIPRREQTCPLLRPKNLMVHGDGREAAACASQPYLHTAMADSSSAQRDSYFVAAPCREGYPLFILQSFRSGESLISVEYLRDSTTA